MSVRFVGIVVVSAAVLAGGCSSSSSAEACREAAEQQAFAEQRWGEEIERHGVTHELGDAVHGESAGEVLGARVEMILAEAETRRSCS